MASLNNDVRNELGDANGSVPRTSNAATRTRSSRPNSDLPAFYEAIPNDTAANLAILRSHLICKDVEAIISHFICVPMEEYHSFLADVTFTEEQKKEWEKKYLLSIPEDSKQRCEIQKMTAQQMKKVCAKLKRRTPLTRTEAYNSLQTMREEELGFHELQSAVDRRQENLVLKCMVLFRFVTSIFSGSYIERLGQINHSKNHLDYETNNTYKGFFEDVSETIKMDFAGEHQGLIFCGPPENSVQFIAYLNSTAIGNQHPFGILTEAQKEYAAPKSCMKHMNDLVKIYQKMIENMGVSGTHANDPFLYTSTFFQFILYFMSSYTNTCFVEYRSCTLCT
jgi:hypothetical protein